MTKNWHMQHNVGPMLVVGWSMNTTIFVEERVSSIKLYKINILIIRNVLAKFKHVGQNIFRQPLAKNATSFDYMNFTSECINEWYNGIVHVNSSIIDSFRDM